MTSTGKWRFALMGFLITDRCPRKHKIEDRSKERDKTHLSQAMVALYVCSCNSERSEAKRFLGHSTGRGEHKWGKRAVFHVTDAL